MRNDSAQRTAAPGDLVEVDGTVERTAHAVCDYIRSLHPELGGKVELRRFTGGNANMTLLIQFGDRAFVVKQEPGGVKGRAAHDMRREYTMLKAVSPVYPYAPEPLLLCEDVSITGNVFCIMERIPGTIMRIAGDAPASLIAQRLNGLVDALAKLHSIDVREARLDHLGRVEGYRERQVAGWIQRWHAARTDRTPAHTNITDWFEVHVPTSPQGAAIVHNDFKMDNLVWAESDPERLVGVLDWEMASIGDPLMDLANTLSFWVEATDPEPLRHLRSMPSAGAGLPTRSDAIERYRMATGRDISDLRFYYSFALFRRAVIEQQKFWRFATGQSDDVRYRHLDQAVEILLTSCRAAMNVD